jgi:predicted Rossmann fold flavoprotein
MVSKKIVVVGGGASGLVAGITAAKQGAKVTILERMDKPGKKLLSTGNGRCNYTNRNQMLRNYRGSHPEFAQNILNQFTLENTIDFFSDLGILPKDRNGYLYPNSNQASSILEVLLMEAFHQRIKLKYNEHVSSVFQRDNQYIIGTDTWEYPCDSVIIAAGSKAAPVLGSDGSGYQLAQALGHHIVTPLPALTALKAKETYFARLSGIRTEAKVTLYLEGDIFCEERGELQLTGYGISGIPVFQISTFAVRGIHEGKMVQVFVDFLPDLSKEELLQLLKERCSKNTHKTMEEMMIGLLNRKLITVLLELAGCSANLKALEVTEAKLMDLTERIKAHKIQIEGCHSYEQAQVCSGGVDTSELYEDTLESRLAPNIYFAGEIIDIDGACGGYNLQWAWSSGYTAGLHAAKGHV